MDTDIESILSGNVYSHGTNWCGVLCLNYPEGIHSWSELAGKPLIYLSLSYFLLVGIRDIIFVGEKEELDYVRCELAPYAEQILFTYEVGLSVPEKRSVLIEYAPVFLYGKDLTRIIERAMAGEEPVRLENPFTRNPEIPLLIYPDGLFSSVGDIRTLIGQTKKMQIERGIWSLPILSIVDLGKAQQLMKILDGVLTERPDDISSILTNRRTGTPLAR